jgi:HSP20 family protein
VLREHLYPSSIMQTYRVASKIPRISCKVLRSPVQKQSSQNMSLFHNLTPGDFSPLVSFLNEFEPARRHSKHSSVRAFRPSFDVSELKDSYQLQGELPGIEQSNINIEFTDQHTLVIKGRTERESQQGTPLAVEAAEEASPSEADTTTYHKATVEEEDNASTAGVPTPATSTIVTVDNEAKSTPKTKYWLSERSIGEFHRSFSFPTRVNQDAVTASLKNGILSVVIPKAPAPVSRRIDIS